MGEEEEAAISAKSDPPSFVAFEAPTRFNNQHAYTYAATGWQTKQFEPQAMLMESCKFLCQSRNLFDVLWDLFAAMTF